MNSREIGSKWEADGWVLVHVQGSHYRFKHPLKSGRVIVPHPKRDLPRGPVRRIYRQAGWVWAEKE